MHIHPGKVFLTALAALLLVASAHAAVLSPETQKLFKAVEENNLAGVQLSVAEGADLEAVDDWGVTALDLAVDKGLFDIVHFLLSARSLQREQRQEEIDNTPPTTVLSQGQPVTPVPTTGVASVPIGNLDIPATGTGAGQPVVGEIYTPPPGGDPWQATVISQTPPPPIPSGTPSPFDTNSQTGTATLPIIGTVQGQVTEVTASPPAPKPKPKPKPKKVVTPVTQKVAAKPAPEPKPDSTQAVAAQPLKANDNGKPQAKEDPGLFGLMKNMFGIDEQEQAAATAKVQPVKTVTPKPTVVATTQQVPVTPKVEEQVDVYSNTNIPLKSTLSEKPRKAVSPPPRKAKSPPPRRELPSSLKYKTEEPSVMPVRPQPPAPTPTTRAKPAPVKETATLRKKAAIETSPTETGRTTPPGKAKNEEGFLDKVTSLFSFGDKDKAKAKPQEAKKVQQEEKDQDWNVDKVEQAKATPRPVTKKKPKIEENILKGVILALGDEMTLGKEPPRQLKPAALTPWHRKTCIDKKNATVTFCIEKVNWPDEIGAHFLTDTVMYDGTQTIARYDEKIATNFHTMFPSQSYDAIVHYYTRRYGKPTRKLMRSIAPLAKPRMENPTVIWRSIAPVTNLVTNLEVRKYDDARGGFPDTKRGAVYLYHEWSRPIFPQLSSVELMMMRVQKNSE